MRCPQCTITTRWQRTVEQTESEVKKKILKCAARSSLANSEIAVSSWADDPSCLRALPLFQRLTPYVLRNARASGRDMRKVSSGLHSADVRMANQPQGSQLERIETTSTAIS